MKKLHKKIMLQEIKGSAKEMKGRRNNYAPAAAIDANALHLTCKVTHLAPGFNI
jgi:hypothetical protein